MGRDAVEQPAVVGDRYNAAGKRLQCNMTITVWMRRQ
jgi:hypothetical protein